MKQPSEDRIRELCQKLIDTDDSADFHLIGQELREALSQHTARLRAKVLEYPGAEGEERPKKP